MPSFLHWVVSDALGVPDVGRPEPSGSETGMEPMLEPTTWEEAPAKASTPPSEPEVGERVTAATRREESSAFMERTAADSAEQVLTDDEPRKEATAPPPPSTALQEVDVPATEMHIRSLESVEAVVGPRPTADPLSAPRTVGTEEERRSSPPVLPTAPVNQHAKSRSRVSPSETRQAQAAAAPESPGPPGAPSSVNLKTPGPAPSSSCTEPGPAPVQPAGAAEPSPEPPPEPTRQAAHVESVPGITPPRGESKLSRFPAVASQPEALSESEPTVHIGRIDIFIETPPVSPRHVAAPSESRESPLASTLFVRRL